MCGIVGLAGNLIATHEKAFENLLIIDSLRGKHSTGVATVNAHSGDVKVAKMALNAFDFLDSKRYGEITKGFSSVLIGHNRYATVGKVNNINAHPFEFDKVVGVHNGTLTARYKLHNQALYDTDSESLYSHINEKGIEDAIANTSGAWALNWYDKEEKTINFLRNKDRPLYIALLEKSDAIAWASEAWMLEGALGRNNIKWDSISLIPENTMLSFKVDKTGVQKPRTRTIKEAPFLVQNAHNRHFSGAGGQNYYGNLSTVATHPLKNSKGILLELIMKVTQPKGVSYYRCRDPLSKDETIKLYVHKGNEDRFTLGDFIICNINSYVASDGSVTVDAQSVEVVEVTPLTTTSEDGTVTFKDHKGNMIDEKEWHKIYGTCGWCTADINPAIEDYILTTSGDAFCHLCKDTEDVKLFTRAA